MKSIHGVASERRRFFRTVLRAAAGVFVLRASAAMAGSVVRPRIAPREERWPPSATDLRAPHDLAG